MLVLQEPPSVKINYLTVALDTYSLLHQSHDSASMNDPAAMYYISIVRKCLLLDDYVATIEAPKGKQVSKRLACSSVVHLIEATSLSGRFGSARLPHGSVIGSGVASLDS